MKSLKFLFPIILLALSFAACNKCDDPILEPCSDFQPNGEYCGWSVATCWSDGGDVGVLYDTRFNSQAPIGKDWKTHTSPVGVFNPSNWTASQIGQVYGIAIDADENVYLASSDIYVYGSVPRPTGNSGRPFSAGQIFKCSPPAYTAVPFTVVPNTGADVSLGIEPLNATGNIAYDKWNHQLFVTNLEDGKIYRIRISDGMILETYDPWTPDTGANRMVGQDERIWGIGVNNENGNVKVYFPRVTTMNASREIYSVTLVGGAFPAAGSEVVEIPGLPGDQPIVSDLAFSSNGLEMLIAERGDPHFAKVQSYSLAGSSWTFNKQYFVGDNAGRDGENSAGGVDFAYKERDGDVSAECDEFFWTTGNFMETADSSFGKVYGMQGISYSGNNSNYSSPVAGQNKNTDLFIDFDGVGGTGPKGGIGDVEVFDCSECVDPCDLNDLPK